MPIIGTISSTNTGGTRGLFGGGYATNYVNTIDYVFIASKGNATDFGDLTVTSYLLGSCASSTRGLFFGGTNAAYPNYHNTIGYVTIATAGNATDFGDLAVGTGSGVNLGPSGCSSDTRGLSMGGYYPGAKSTIQYMTIATTGNSTNFGDLTVARTYTGSFSSTTRGICTGGYADGPTYYNTIDYVTISTTGNATDFGDTSTTARYYHSGASSSTRGLICGGGFSGSTTNSNVIDYVTIATTGNAIDFGDLSSNSNGTASTSNKIRAIIHIGSDGTNYVNTVDEVTIATTGNSTDFGDLTQSRGFAAGCSNGHGGL